MIIIKGQQAIDGKENVIHLDIYVDEAKQIKYNGLKMETITYIMLLAVPTDKKYIMFNRLNNARCLNPDNELGFSVCDKKCDYHHKNNSEIHYNEINQGNSRIKKNIAERWINILLDNNFKNENAIYFNILGIIENNIDLELFGNKKHSNMYSRFFRTNLLRLLRMFDKYDTIIIENIYHDKTNEMEQHKYFKTNAIQKIKNNSYKNDRIKFCTESIEFIDSKHYKSDKPIESQFIQFVDLILGVTVNVIHNNASTDSKKYLSNLIYPLIFRIIDSNYCKNKNSKYNYFNKQAISFFPKLSKEEIISKYANIDEKCIDMLLSISSNFDNNKEILFKEDLGQQLSFF